MCCIQQHTFLISAPTDGHQADLSSLAVADAAVSMRMAVSECAFVKVDSGAAVGGTDHTVRSTGFYSTHLKLLPTIWR